MKKLFFIFLCSSCSSLYPVEKIEKTTYCAGFYFGYKDAYEWKYEYSPDSIPPCPLLPKEYRKFRSDFQKGYKDGFRRIVEEKEFLEKERKN